MPGIMHVCTQAWEDPLLHCAAACQAKHVSPTCHAIVMKRGVRWRAGGGLLGIRRLFTLSGLAARSVQLALATACAKYAVTPLFGYAATKLPIMRGGDVCLCWRDMRRTLAAWRRYSRVCRGMRMRREGCNRCPRRLTSGASRTMPRRAAHAARMHRRITRLPAETSRGLRHLAAAACARALRDAAGRRGGRSVSGRHGEVRQLSAIAGVLGTFRPPE